MNMPTTRDGFHSPGGIPIEAFDGLSPGLARNRSQFYFIRGEAGQESATLTAGPRAT